MNVQPDSTQSSYLPHFARPNRQTWPKTEDTNEEEEEEEARALETQQNTSLQKKILNYFEISYFKDFW